MNIRRIAQLSLAANFLLVGLTGGFTLAHFVFVPRGETVSLPAAAPSRLASVPSSGASASLADPVGAPVIPSARPFAASPSQGASSRAATVASSNISSRGASSATIYTSSPASHPTSSDASSTASFSAPISSSSGSVPASYGYSNVAAPNAPFASGGSGGNGYSGSGAATVRNITGSVTPDGQGNSFVTKGQKVAVQDAPANSDGTPSEDLALSVTPATDSNSAADSAEGSSSSQKTSPFTREQDLFRAKWGWNSYAQAERAAWDSSLGH